MSRENGKRGINRTGQQRQALVKHKSLAVRAERVPAGACGSPGCRRIALTRASGYRFCFFHDENIPDRVKREARVAGGHAPKGAVRYLPPESPDPLFKTPEHRIAFREAIAGAVLRGELSEGPAGVGLRACDGAGDDDDRRIAGRLDALEKAWRLKKAGNW